MPTFYRGAGLGTYWHEHDARILDPVVEIARTLGSPYDMRSYHHDGDASFLLGVVDPSGHESQLRQHAKLPPPALNTARHPDPAAD